MPRLVPNHDRKLPLPSTIFPSSSLSRAKQHALEALAERQLAQAELQVDEYERHNGVIDLRRWKRVKTRSQLSIFQERSRPAGQDDTWRLPHLLAVGSLGGTVENVLYGLQGPSHILGDQLAHTHVLHEFQGPTHANPFRSLGLKWLVGWPRTVLGAVVSPRDVIGLEHTGIKRRADGSKLGHVVLHSVALPQYPELREELGLVRARVSLCVLLSQRSTHVDVFIIGRVAAHGHILDRLALVAAVNALTNVMNAGTCAQQRKLAWRVRHNRHFVATGADVSAARCPLCIKPVGRSFSSPGHCRLCGVRMCSRCRVDRKLIVRENHEVSVELCSPCITRASADDAAAIVRQEIQAGEYGTLTSPKHSKYRGVDFSASVGPSRIRPQSQPHIDFAASLGVGRRTKPLTRETQKSSSALDCHFVESKDVKDRGNGTALQLQDLDVRSEPESSPKSERSMMLWKRMTALHVMAELTYRYTKETTEKLLSRRAYSPTSSSTTVLL